MANYLVTGGTGFLGQRLVAALRRSGHYVFVLTRRPVHDRYDPYVEGDVLQEGLGIRLSNPPRIEGLAGVWHLAAKMDLGQDKDGSVYQTNVLGTSNVLNFCQRFNLPLYYCSTAYTMGRNAYEKSKAACETLIAASSDLAYAIYKPSILIADSRDGDPGSTRGFYQFVGAMARVHRRAELIRRRIEGTLRLPVIEPALRIRGNPEATLNLLPVDVAAEFMASHTELGHTYHVTNPQPPTLAHLAKWVGEAILLRVRFQPEFKATPIEAVLGRLTRSFNPYLWGDVLTSDLPQGEPLVTPELVNFSVTRAILSL